VKSARFDVERHVLENTIAEARWGVAWLDDRVSSDLEGDTMLRYAIQQTIVRVGGGAVSAARNKRLRCSQAPWHRLVRQGRRFRKRYDQVTAEEAIAIVRSDFPTLISAVERCLDEHPAS